MAEWVEPSEDRYRQPGLRLWLWWVLANIVGGVIGEALGSVVSQALGSVVSQTLLGTDSNGALPSIGYTGAYLYFITPAAAIWVVLGLAQWVVLWRYSYDVSWLAGVWWVLVSTIGGLIAVLAGMFAFFMATFMLGAFSSGPSISFGYVAGGIVASAIVGAIAGAFVGASQFLALRRYVNNAIIWIPGNAVAWAVGLLVVTAVLGGDWLAISAVAGATNPLGSILIGGIAVSTAACVTGFVLVKLPPKPVVQNRKPINWKRAIPSLAIVGLAPALIVVGLLVGIAWYSDTVASNPPGQVRQFSLPGVVRGVTWSPDGNLLAAGSRDGTVLVWDAGNNQTIVTLPGPGPGSSEFDERLHNLNNVAWSPDGSYLATSSSDKSQAIKVWGTKSWQAVFTAPIEPNGQFTATVVTDLAWSADSKALGVSIPTAETCCENKFPEPGLIEIFDIPGGRIKATFVHPISVLSLTWAPDNNKLAFSAVGYLLIDRIDDNILIWESNKNGNLSGSSNARVLVGHLTDNPLVLRWSPNGKYLAAGFYGGGLSVWDATNGSEIAKFTELKRTVNDIAWSPDSTLLAVTSDDTMATIWEIASKRKIASFQHPKWATSVAWSPGGQFIATGCEDKKVRLWKVK